MNFVGRSLGSWLQCSSSISWLQCSGMQWQDFLRGQRLLWVEYAIIWSFDLVRGEFLVRGVCVARLAEKIGGFGFKEHLNFVVL